MQERSSYAQLILCGGEGRRMASAYEHKALAVFQGRTLIEHTLDKQIPSHDAILLSCGPALGHEPDSAKKQQALSEILSLGNIPCEPIFDQSEQHLGPLAGILSGLEYCIQHRPQCQHLLVCPVDTPEQPSGLGKALLALATSHPEHIIVSECQGRTQPLHSLWPIALHRRLEQYLNSGERRVMGFIKASPYQTLRFPDSEAFRNINSPEDLSP